MVLDVEESGLLGCYRKTKHVVKGGGLTSLGAVSQAQAAPKHSALSCPTLCLGGEGRGEAGTAQVSAL